MSQIIHQANVLSFSEQVWARQRQQWMAEHWNFLVVIGCIYVALVFTGQSLMKRRCAFNLQPFLIAWNLGLTIFSVLGVCYMIPEMMHVLDAGGLKLSVCDNGYMLRTPSCSLWAWFFVASKVLELGDTMFIVLRKKPLMFLHWYHHLFTMLGVSYSYATGHGVGRWVVCMNYFVHSFMYGYYTLRALKVKVPKPVAVMITASQIVQMFLGFALSLWAMIIYLSGEPCHATLHNSLFSISMYMSYFFLFVHFFKRAYGKKSDSKVSKTN